MNMANYNTFHLYSNNFETNIKSSWKAFQIEHDFCDVTLACEDRTVDAHKMIISAGSPVLKNILKLNKSMHPLIFLRNVGYKDLENLLNFMYQGEVNILEKDVANFLKVAQDLKINGLFNGTQEDAEVVEEDKREKEKSTQLISKYTLRSSKRETKLDHKTVNEDSSELNNTDFVKEIKEILPDPGKITFPEEKKDCTQVMDQNIPISLSSNHSSDNQRTENIDEHSSIGGSNDVSQLLTMNYDTDVDVDKSDNDRPLVENHVKIESQEIFYFQNVVFLNGRKFYNCKKCNLKLPGKSYLDKHNASNHQDMQLSCKKCNFKAKRKDYLKVHIEATHKGVRFYCELCDYKAKQKINLKVHIDRIHIGVKYFCDRCDYGGKSKDQVKLHIQAKHEGSQYPCDECDYIAIQKTYLRKHYLRKHRKSARRHKCSICDNKYRTKDKLKAHIESTHKGVQYSCSQCEYKANQKVNLKKHIQKNHNSEPFFCDICQYTTTLKLILKEHIETTHETSCVSCETCDKLFSNSSNLLKHVVSQHKDVSYQCDQCGFEAHLRENLNYHIVSQHK